MPPMQLPLLLLCLTLWGVCLSGRQPLPEESETMGSPLDDILQRSESLILQSVLKKAEKDKETNKESKAPLPEWLSKRQHPGAKYLSNLEKRQHPGKRDVDKDTSYGDIQKRQHPGKKEIEDNLDVDLELQKQQAAGRGWLLGQVAASPRSALSKRQHPGKRHLRDEHQHPSKGGWDYKADLNDQHGEKHQHHGKRHWNSDSSDHTGPCSFQEFLTCNKGSLLLDLVAVSRDRVEEKRQHPGKRSTWESETVE
ncbi:thyrotropin releasing hormone [Pithys albifrons albifrons]|uniref:thyrotropin releasing hormone n=1 Tax=Pithys albifrons albifrons TaxID=3385563 RepID=UPI003A5CCA7E